ncbi:outer membrane beta-barrel protein [Photobacterium damselae]|uniref:outer membrane beta-barrel protein n=1 Tax=Photobacterium damselae TaxID=38293 RepID=UPI001EDDC76A|nr:outer membrane beta-barrel protein [Photobacterium damselae]MCG3825945.1 porin family protein [Photobacterium damselae]
MSSPYIGMDVGKNECELCNKSKYSYGLNFGYRVKDNLAFQFDYIITDLSDKLDSSQRLYILSIYPKLSVALSNNFRLFSGLGLGFINLNHDDYRALTGNIGLRYSLNENVSMNLEYKIYSNVDGKKNVDDISLFNIGVNYAF